MSQNLCPSIITDVARTWLDTPFRWHGRLKGVGCDCLGLVMGVAGELELCDRYGRPLIHLDRTDYHIINDGRVLMAALENNLIRVSELKPGYLVLMEYDNNPQHLAIIGDYGEHNFSLIHAHISCRKVVEHILDNELRERINIAFKL